MTAVIQVFEQFALRVLMRPLGRREYSFVEPMKKLFVGRGIDVRRDCPARRGGYSPLLIKRSGNNELESIPRNRV
ncbi:hypothetical protein QF000_000304 [Paraburkholderia atlantica]